MLIPSCIFRRIICVVFSVFAMSCVGNVDCGKEKSIKNSEGETFGKEPGGRWKLERKNDSEIYLKELNILL